LHILADGIPRRSLSTALLVGTILNLVNRSGGQASFNFIEIALTYALLYCVGVYGAVSYRVVTTQAGGELAFLQKESSNGTVSQRQRAYMVGPKPPSGDRRGRDF
jgi:hypothetical protein